MLAPFCWDEHAQTHAKTCLFKTNNNLRPQVQTNAFSFENANILLRFHVPPHQNDENDDCMVFDENANF